MSMPCRTSSFVSVAAFLFAALSVAQCGGSSTPTGPTTSGSSISGVTLNASRIGIGGTTQGTVTVAAAPTAAATVTLSSSNAAVATVQSPITVPAGATTATFTLTGTGAGTAIVTATLNSSSSQSPAVTVASVALATISLSASTVVGGKDVTGTVGLTAPAPVAGAIVALTAGDPLTVQPSVTVPAGATTATFSVLTRLVGGTIAGTVTGAYGGTSMTSAPISVTKPTVATANFGITGTTESDTCTMTNNGTTIKCTFNGSTSTAPGNIIAWDWTYRVSTGAPFSQTTSGPVLVDPTVNCTFLPPPPLPVGGNSWLPFSLTLKVHDDLGNVSAEFTNNGTARIFPQGCGY
jgi:hypothetical protein